MKYYQEIASSPIFHFIVKSWMSQGNHPWISFSGIFYFVLQFPDDANGWQDFFVSWFFTIFNCLFLIWAKNKKQHMSGAIIFHHSEREKKVTASPILVTQSVVNHSNLLYWLKSNPKSTCKLLPRSLSSLVLLDLESLLYWSVYLVNIPLPLVSVFLVNIPSWSSIRRLAY